jgi:two-component system, LytTR family, response regulator
MSEDLFSVAIVDDEPPARAKLRHYIAQHALFHVRGEAGSGAAAIRMLSEWTPSLLFLDIELPDISGFDVILTSPLPPESVVVFATAHEQHALRAFEAHAMDYLVKPISPVRFAKLMARVEQRLVDAREAAVARAARRNSEKLPDSVTCRYAGRSIPVTVRDIVFIESARNYTVLHLQSGTHILRRTLESFAQTLDPERFVRIGRSVIVNREFVRAVAAASHGDYKMEMKTGHQFTWTRKYHGLAKLIRSI